jgi:hypothetical protein
MPANQTSNQRNKSGNSRQASQAQRRPAHEAEESSSGFGGIGEMAAEASDYVTQRASQAQECIGEHAGASVAVSLVAGFGIGLLIGHALGASHREPRSWRDRATAEGFGRRLMERIESMVPDALSEHFGK